MKPVILEFEGINSFSEHTIIDFEKLTKSGIFGIFGDTGSGKSTILDCINFALYGKVERSKEKTDIINYNCSVARVKFTFNILNEGRRKTYYIERSLKRDKNGSGAHKAFLYEDGVCIADKPQEAEKKIIDILGVEADDFRKCIALPQGEFSQFVRSAPRERLSLIERLFNLSRYGDRLKEKISSRQEETEKIYQNVSGRLSGYADFTDEAAEEASRKLVALKSKIKKLNKELQVCEKNFAVLSALYDKKCELERITKSLDELNMQRPRIEKLRKDLAILPVCRSVLETVDAIERNKLNACEIEKSIAQASEVYKVIVKRIEQNQSALAEGDFDNKTELLTRRAANFAACAGKPAKLSELERQLASKRDNYSKLDRERRELIEERERVAKSIEDIKKLIEETRAEDLDQFVNVKFKGAILRGEYVSMLDYFVDLRSRIECFCEDSELYKYLQTELKSQIDSYKKRIYDIRDFKLENVNEQFELLQQVQKLREENNAKLSKLSQLLSELEGKIKIKENELATLKRDGAELRNRADELKLEIIAVYGKDCSDYVAAEASNSRELNRIRSEKQHLLSLIEGDKKQLGETEIDIEKSKVTLRAAAQENDKLQERLQLLVKTSGLGGVEQCRELANEFMGFADADNYLTSFDKNFYVLSAKKDELQSTDGINTISDKDVYESEQAKNKLASDILKLSGDIAVLESETEQFKVKLAEKRDILKEFASVEKERNLISQLKEVVKSNRFLEFVANEYLCDISLLASTTLLKLTDGRYFLTYKDNNFQVGDNFNCGNLRGVNTLSGGETFLVSLSLALALSQTICAKSMKSIEFFFLDEGFGTLDGTLVDTVMSALEKLKSSAFTIGVISHVEELKHRIDSKITVFKATESHGSTVQLSC